MTVTFYEPEEGVTFYVPEEGTELEHRIAAGKLFVPAGDGDSVSTLPTLPSGDADSVSIAPILPITPRDADILCPNGMLEDYGYERHPGNMKLKEIIEHRARREQWNTDLNESVLEEVIRTIENQVESPSFLIQNFNREWRKADHDAIKKEISGVWAETIYRHREEANTESSAGSKTLRPRLSVIPDEEAFNDENKGDGNSDATAGHEFSGEKPGEGNDSNVLGGNVWRVPQRVRCAIVIFVVLAIILSSVLGAALPRKKRKKETEERIIPPTAKVKLDTESATLSTILSRGRLKCGVMAQSGFAQQDEQGIWKGFDVDLCRAVAAGIFGKEMFRAGHNEPVEFISMDAGERFPSLNNKTIDLLLGMTSQTFGRSLYEENTKAGYTFSTPYLVTGLTFAGPREYLDCISNTTSPTIDNDMIDDFCQDTRVCVLRDTTHEEKVEEFMIGKGFSEANVIRFTTLRDYYDNPVCNLWVGEEFDLVPEVLEEHGSSAQYEVWDQILSRELFSIATRDGDAKFSDFVNYIVQSLMTAEELRIRAAAPIDASDLDETNVFGPRYQTMFKDAFEVVGGYGQLYDEHLETLVPRPPANEINEDTAAMYSKPLGNVNLDIPPEQKSPTIEKILERGLRVGVGDSPMFSAIVNGERQGIDIDFAKAISAALFDGDQTRVKFVVVSTADRFVKLKDGEVDMLARVTTLTMERDVKEEKTNQGFTFSTPTFHDSIRFVGISNEYVQCAEEFIRSGFAQCPEFKVCVTRDTTQSRLMLKGFEEDMLVVTSSPDETIESFAKGECEVFVSGVHERTRSSIRMYYDGDYVVGNTTYSRESLALVTNEDDVIFSKLVDLVVNAILYADENNITAADYLDMPRINLFWPFVSEDGMLKNVIRAVGNYQEIWNRHFKVEGLERDGRNKLNTEPWGPMLITEQGWDKPPPSTVSSDA